MIGLQSSRENDQPLLRVRAAATIEQPVGRPFEQPLEQREGGHFVDLVVEEWV